MSLADLVERERRGVARLSGLFGLSVLLGLMACVVALAVLLLDRSRWLLLPRAVPYVLWVFIAGIFALGVVQVRRYLVRQTSLRGVAREVERSQSLRDGALQGTLEVADSGALGQLAATNLAARLAAAPAGALAPQLRRTVRRRAVFGSVGAVAGLVVLGVFGTSATDGWAALAHPLKAWRGTLLDGVRLEGVPKAVLRGERLTFSVRAPGRLEVTVLERATGASWREQRFPVDHGVARVRLGSVDADVTVVATDGRATSDTALVRMVERPFIGDVTARATFPGYLDRKEETVALGEPARLPQGTSLVFDGQSSTQLTDVHLTREGGGTVAMQVDGRRFTGRMSVATSGTYRWSAAGSGGPIADVPSTLDIEVIPDSAPHVEILSPGGDSTVSAGDTVSISVLATDDHGLGGIDLRSWMTTATGETRPWSSRAVALKNEPQWAGETAITTTAMKPGDALHVVVAATDLSPWHQTGTSHELILRLPTLAEQRAALRAAADSTVERATATASAEKQLQQRTSDASKRQDRQTENSGNSRSGQNPMSYETAEQVKEYAKEQRQLAERMQQLEGAAKQLEQQLRQAGSLDSALQARLREAQKLLSEALTPELAAQLKKLEQASQKLSADEARKALADLAQQQQRLREQLEKSVEMLKRAALEGSMATLKDDASDLARQERRLADSLGKAANQQSQQSDQRDAKDLSARARDLADQVKQLEQRLQQENAQTGAQRAAQAEKRVEESAQSMDRAAQNDARQTANPQQPRAQQAADSQAGRQANASQQTASQSGSPQGAQQQKGQAQSGQAQRGQSQSGQSQSGQSQSGQSQASPNQNGQSQSGKSQTGQAPNTQQQGNQQNANAASGQQSPNGTNQGQRSGESAARQAAQAMDDAANELAKAREQQVGEWKQELTTELDRSIEEMIQLARQQDALEQKATQGAPTEDLRAEQGTLQQGVEKSAQRLQDAAQKSSLLSQRTLHVVDDARKKVAEATRQTQSATTAHQIASAMGDASESLNQAAASLVRDRERAQNASSASGFAEMLQQLQQMATQQSLLNSAVQDLLPRPGSQLDASGQQAARQLARQQRDVASKLDDLSDRDETGRAEELAKEARQIAQALQAAQLDPGVLDRQQRLFRKMLDAGKLLEDDQRQDTGKREAKAWTGTEVFTPQSASASGKSATKFQTPDWNELRGLTPEERRLVLEYFKKINGDRP